MKNFLNKLLAPKVIEIVLTPPAKFPNWENVPQWMTDTVDYWAKAQPQHMHMLFNPSSGDYIPLKIVCGTGKTLFRQNLELYRELKDKYHEAVAEAKKNFLDYSYSWVGDERDFPKNHF